jgi:putative inorganic carbon (hco3(-)) transporter
VLTQATMWQKAPAMTQVRSNERHWDLGLLAMLLYLVVEYTRLPTMYPVLSVLYLGKVSVALAMLAYFCVPREKVGRLPGVGAIDFVVVLFLVVSFLSCCFARYQSLAWETFSDEVRWGLIYFLIGRVVSNSWRMNVFVMFLLLLNAKLAQFTIRSYFHELASGMPGWYLAKTGIGGLAGGFFANGEDLGLGMVVVWPIAGYILLAQKKTLYKWGMFGIFLLILLAILFCGSRGALVGAGMVAFAAWVRKPNIKAAMLMVLVFVPAVIYVMPQANMDRMRSAEKWENDATASHRILLWKAGMRMFPDYPILGVGPSNYALVRMTDYSQDDPHPSPTVQHNTFVEALTDLGLLGLLCFLALIVLLLRLNAKTRKLLLEAGAGAKESYEYCLALGLDLALVGFLSSGFFHSSLYYPHLWILLGLSVGLHTACAKKRLATASAPGLAEQRSSYALAAS